MKLSFITTVSAIICMSCNSSPEQTYTPDTSLNNAQVPPAVVTTNASIGTIIESYMHIKNALVIDNSSEAATAAEHLTTEINSMDETGLEADQKSVFSNTKEKIKDHAAKISSNADNINKQRESFENLSTNMYSLAKSMSPDQTIYYTKCPMYNKGKGGFWLSTDKEIKNPYYGSKMVDCGEVIEELK